MSFSLLCMLCPLMLAMFSTLFFALNMQLLFSFKQFWSRNCVKVQSKEKTLESYNTTQCSAMQSYGKAERQKEHYAMFCSCLRCPSYSSLHGVLERYNAMQCNAMECNGIAEPEKNAMSCSCHCKRCP